MDAAVETRELTRAFGGHVAVDNLNVRVPQGSIFGYLGLNGAGKTTTIRMLTTLLRPTSGTARILGHDVVADRLAVRAGVGLVGDESGETRPSWSAREYVGYFAGIRRLPNRRSAVEAALDAVGLEPAWRARPLATYSTGMKRRVELARALVGRPRLLFLDEPTRGLDLPAKRQIWDLLRDLRAREGVTVFVSSHEVAEILALCGDLAVISRGRLVHRGTTSSLGSDVATFERRLIELLERSPQPRTTFALVERRLE